jgi:hypothetical protein
LLGGTGNDGFRFSAGEGGDVIGDFARVAGNMDIIRLANVVDVDGGGITASDFNNGGQNNLTFTVSGSNLIMVYEGTTVTISGGASLYTTSNADTIDSLLTSGALSSF